MIEILNIALNNNFIYGGIVAVLIVIIVLTILSIKKDRDKVMASRRKEVDPVLEPAATKEEQEKARFELSKAINDMQQEIDNKPTIDDNDIKSYEQDQEQNAIISYQELVEAVRKQNVANQPQTEVGMEVADNKAIEEPNLEPLTNDIDYVDNINIGNVKPVEIDNVNTKSVEESTNTKVEDIVEMLNSVKTDTPVYEEKTIATYPDEPDHATVTETVIYKEEPLKEPENLEHPMSTEERKFQTSEFISPVFGRNPQGDIKVVDRNQSLDEVIDSVEEQDNDEFLDNLKNFRERL